MDKRIYNQMFVEICHTDYGLDLTNYSFPEGTEINQLKYRVHRKIVHSDQHLLFNIIHNPDAYIAGAIKSLQNKRHQYALKMRQ